MPLSIIKKKVNNMENNSQKFKCLSVTKLTGNIAISE